MEVREEDAVTAECDGEVFYFCSEGCRDKFLKEREKSVPVKGAFISIGLQPNTFSVSHLVKSNDSGEIVIGADCSTSCPGAFCSRRCHERLRKKDHYRLGRGGEGCAGGAAVSPGPR
jgi:alkyl hydroperoxide reductase subunit AhpF